ncbi:MAG: pitrilysin family protein [Armatimonadota bacterium]|nr:pitrilysin family protein [Armatimonadota bacterium]
MGDLFIHRLENGLMVVLREHRASPVATFWVWYRVGARNEVPGFTGISHWVEHMLFKGTSSYGKGDLVRIVDRHGGTWNAFTWKDYTAYFEVLPSEHIDLALRLEADRMTNALFDPREVESERTVVISEREGLENFPQFYLREEVEALAFKVHPYRNPVIGWKEDLRRIAREDLYRHYRTYYHPNNALIVAVGDFSAPSLLKAIEEMFGPIPPAEQIPEVHVQEPPQDGERRLVLRRPGPTAYVHLAYHAPQASHPDFVPLLVVDGLLSGFKGIGFQDGQGSGRSSRLYRALVDRGLATEVSSAYPAQVDPTLFHIEATVRTGVDPQRVEQAILDEIHRLKEEPVPEDELAKVKKQARAQLAYTSDGVFGQAVWLGTAAIVSSVDLYTGLLDAIERVSQEDILRVCQRYLRSNALTSGWFLPEPGGGGVSGKDAPSVVAWWNPGTPKSSPALHVRLTPETVRRSVLPNGLVVLVHENPASNSVVVHGAIQAGAMVEERAQEGAAKFVAASLLRGTSRRTSREIAEELDRMGAGLVTRSALEVTTFSGRSLAEDLPHLLDIVADVLIHPTFPDEEIEKVRGEMLTSIREAEQNTQKVAERIFRNLAFPEGHPHRKHPEGREEVVAALTRNDLALFHRAHYRPDATILAVVGDVQAGRVIELVEELFGKWQADGAKASFEVPEASLPPAPQRELVVLPGKSQADIVLGVPGIPRRSEDYHATLMANLILGQLGMMGRLGANIREQKGMAYYAFSQLQAGLLAGPWWVRAGVNPRNVESAIETILEEIHRLQEELVDEGELSDARGYLIGSLAIRHETNQGMAQALVDMELYQLGLDYLVRFPGIVSGIDPEAIQRAAQRFSLTGYTVAIAGPEI